MRPTRLVIRSAAGMFAAAVLVTAWRASVPSPPFRASARIEIAEDAATDVADEFAALERRALADGLAVLRVDDTNVIEISSQASDPAAAVQTVNAVIDEYVRTREADRTRRVAAMLAETAAEVTRQTARVRRVERDLATAQSLLARVTRDRQSAASHLLSLERSIARAQERLAGLEPLVAHLRGGRPAESLSVVRNTPIVQALQARVALLDMERAALLTRYGPTHPKLERNAGDRAAVHARLQVEIANVVDMVTHDYETTRLDKQWLEGARDKALLISTQPLPSRAEYTSLVRRLEAERAVHAALVTRRGELARIADAPGPGVTVVDRAWPVPQTPARPSPWPWALGMLAVLGVGLAVPPVVRGLRRVTARVRTEKFPAPRETPPGTTASQASIAENLKKTA